MRFRPRVGKKIIRSRLNWGVPIKVVESLLDQPIKGGDESLLVHRISRRVKGKVDLHSAVGGAQVTCPDEQPSDQAQRTSIAKDVVSPGGGKGLLGDASWLGGRLAPSGGGSAKVGPPLGSDEIHQGGEVGGISIDVPD